MNSELSKPESRIPNPGPGPCPQCDGTGWMRITEGGVSRVTRCVCRTRNTPAQEAERPGGFEPLAAVMQRSPAVKAAISATDTRVAELIQAHRGAGDPITIRDIIATLWPGTSMDINQAERYVRQIKDSVKRLRNLAEIPIAASKAKPYGYFIAQTAGEMEDMYERHKSELIEHAKICKLFARDRNLVRELEGQLGL